MNINPYVIELLQENDIETAPALLYLLGIYHNIPADGIIDDDIIKKVNLLKIVTRDYDKNRSSWNIPLFEATNVVVEKAWDWVLTTYRDMFTNIDGGKGGDRTACLNKMKKFFAENPEYRKVDVLNAAKHYTDTFRIGNNPKYMMQADYFIAKKIDGIQTSKLKTVIEELEKIADKKVETEDRYHGKIK